LADVVLNNILFYASYNTYPETFKTPYNSVNNSILIYGSNQEYVPGGSIYIRLRPNFGLYDLIAKREYIFFLNAFSQAPASNINGSYGYDTLTLGKEIIGFVNMTNY
jgi:hypothetical protein